MRRKADIRRRSKDALLMFPNCQAVAAYFVLPEFRRLTPVKNGFDALRGEKGRMSMRYNLAPSRFLVAGITPLPGMAEILLTTFTGLWPKSEVDAIGAHINPIDE